MKTQVILLVNLFVFLSLGMSLAGAADYSQGRNSSAELEEMVVTASRTEEVKRDVTTNITVVTEEEISLYPVDDLGELLGQLNIGHIQQYPGASTSIGMRGFRTDATGNDLGGHVLFLLNGRRTATGNAAKIMTKNIDRIEIVRGPASVQYGSAAVGGVINVITKQGKGKPTAFIEGGLGSFGHEEGTVGGSGAWGKFDFSGTFTRQLQDDYDTGEGHEYDNTGYDDKESASLNLGYEFLPKNRLGFIYNYFDADEVGNPGYFDEVDTDDYTDKENESFDIVYDGSTPDGLFTWMARYFQTDDEDYWMSTSAWGKSESERETDQEGVQAQVAFNPGLSRIMVGIDWVNYDIDSTWDPQETEYDNPSYFLLGKTKLLDEKLILSGGVRYDDYELEVKEGQGEDEDDNHVSPRFGLAYLLNKSVKFRLNYGEAFVMPTPQQMASDYTSWGVHYVGNPGLDPEESQTYEAGVDLNFKDLFASLTYFYTDFEDKIESVSKPNQVETWENIGDARIHGLEGSLDYDLSWIFDWDLELRPYLNFTYFFEYEDEDTHDDLPYISDLQASYGVILRDGNGLSADLNFAYTGEQDVNDWENSGGMGTAPPVVEKGGYTVANLSVHKRLVSYEKYGSWTLQGEIRNLLDKDYSYVKGYPMPGRAFYLGLRYDY